MERTGRLRASGAAEPRISAVICTHERPQALARALRSLLRQSAPADEILVIDNAPASERTRAVVEEAAASGSGLASGLASVPASTSDFGPHSASAPAPPPIRYLREPVQGLDFARNRALAAARSEVVAFLDDDAVADEEWIRETRRAFVENPELAACMGRVEALTLDTPGARLFEANGGFARGRDPILIPRDAGRKPLIAWSIALGSGCSMALRRRHALELGGFDEALDMGASLPGGGDLDILWRILASGGEVRYEPQVRALHEHREDALAAARQIADHNRGLVAMLVKALHSAPGPRRVPVGLFLGWRLVKPGTRVVRRVLGRDPLPMRTLLHLWRSCWQGLGAYSEAREEVNRRRRAGPSPEGEGGNDRSEGVHERQGDSHVLSDGR